MKNICYGCKNRAIGCHSSCEEYKTYRLEKDKAIQERHKRNEAMGVFIERRSKKQV